MNFSKIKRNWHKFHSQIILFTEKGINILIRLYISILIGLQLLIIILYIQSFQTTQNDRNEVLQSLYVFVDLLLM